MQESCLEKARQVREEMERMRGGTGHHHHPSHHHPSHHHPSQVSAERLLLMEALDMVCMCAYVIRLSIHNIHVFK